jgi:hypothetical protein
MAMWSSLSFASGFEIVRWLEKEHLLCKTKKVVVVKYLRGTLVWTSIFLQQRVLCQQLYILVNANRM